MRNPIWLLLAASLVVVTLLGGCQKKLADTSTPDVTPSPSPSPSPLPACSAGATVVNVNQNWGAKGIGSGGQVAQSFQPGCTGGVLKSVSVYANCYNTGQSTSASVKLYGAGPVGSFSDLIETQAIANIPDTQTWYTATFTSNPALDGYTTYWLLLQNIGSYTLSLYTDGTQDLYTNGAAYFFSGTWARDSFNDNLDIIVTLQ
jgi:hypothetical protein